MTSHPTPERYLSFRQALLLLQKRIGATKADFVCWTFFDELKAYCHVHEFAKPPEFNLAGIALTNWQSAGNDSPPYLKALDDAFFLVADVDAFDPPNRYIAFADLVQRWLPNCESQELTANFIRSRVHQSRLRDFAPWLGETELSRVFFPSLPDDWERPRPPADWAMFKLAEVEAIEASDFPDEEQGASLQQGGFSEKVRSIPSHAPQSNFVFDPSVAETEYGLRKLILDNWIEMTEKYGAAITAAQIHRFICAINPDVKKPPALKSVHNRLNDLRKEKKLPQKC